MIKPLVVAHCSIYQCGMEIFVADSIIHVVYGKHVDIYTSWHVLLKTLHVPNLGTISVKG